MFQSKFKNIAISGLILILNLAVYSNPSTDVLSNTNLEKFGSQLEQSIASGNPYFFNLSFDGKTLVKNVIDEFVLIQDQEFDQGFIDGFLQSFDLGVMLVNEINIGSSFTFLHAEKNSFNSLLLFRIVSLQGINYHEYAVEEVQGVLKITDAYIYSTGQRISESVRALYKEYTSQVKVRDDKMENTLIAIEHFSKEGKLKKVFHNWNKLPIGFKTNKMALAQGLGSSIYVGKRSFDKTLDLFNTYYPTEPSKYFIPLEGLIAFKHYNQALQYIDTLDIVVDQDPMLNFLRANVYYEADNFNKAADCLGELIETMPTFEIGYLSLLEIYLNSNRFEEATELVSKMMIAFQSIKEEFIPYFSNFPAFLDSNAYQNWLQQ